MILCTFGTHPQPFDRALDWVIAAAEDEELVIQRGATSARPEISNARWHEFLGYEELTGLMKQADASVCHAGVGTLMTAIGLGVVPVAIPRLRSENEHVDDHQLQIARELGGSGYVVPCERREEMSPAVARARSAAPPSRSGGEELRRAAILAAGGAPSRQIV